MKDDTKPEKKPFDLNKPNNSDWLKNKIFEQRRSSQIKQVQFHGSRHRG